LIIIKRRKWPHYWFLGGDRWPVSHDLTNGGYRLPCSPNDTKNGFGGGDSMSSGKDAEKCAQAEHSGNSLK